jgi:hypothetical protein
MVLWVRVTAWVIPWAKLNEAGTDPTNTKHEHSQGYSDASRGINKNPYGPNTPAGKAYMDGQAAYKRHFGESQELNLIRSRAGLARNSTLPT